MIGLEISAPVVIALVITDAAFGLIARAVPQMNMFFVGLPAKILVGFAGRRRVCRSWPAHLTDELKSSVARRCGILNRMSENRTEAATPKRRDEARKKGQVVKSADINTAVVLLAGVGTLAVIGGRAC